MSDNTGFPKITSINFTVRNNLSAQTVTIFGYTLFPGESKDLLEIAEISEADIRHALIKGDLSIKLRNESLVVVSSSIDLMQFDPEQRQFLIDLGITSYGVVPEAIVEIGDSLYLKLDPITDEDAPNGSMYIAEDGQLSFKDENGEFGPISGGGGGGEVTPTAVITALSTANDTVKFNYQRLNSVAHPVPFYNHGVPTVGWAKSQYLRTLDLTVIADDNNGNGETITLTQKSWQGVVQVNKNNWATIQFPVGPHTGDIVDVYVEQGATCLLIDTDNGDTSVSGKSITRFTFQSGEWSWGDINEETWINAVTKNAVIKSEAVNIFPSGTNLSGTYDGDVIIFGSTTLTNEVLIHGSLYTTNVVTNTDGYALTVRGDMIVDSLNFTPDEQPGFQGNITIKGNFRCNDFDFQVYPPQGEYNTSISIEGDCLVTGTLNGTGLNTHGLQVIVDGNAFFYIVDLSGANADGVNPAGSGADLYVGGNLSLQEFRSIGGNNINGPQDQGAGSGGNVQVRGNIYRGSYTINGGDSSPGIGDSHTSDAGDGGDFLCGGDAHVDYITANGGDCTSTHQGHRAGQGGAVTINGSMWIGNGNTLTTRGGYRAGSLSEAADVLAADGGNIVVKGNLHAPSADINTRGGDVETENFAPARGGRGGNVIVGGILTHKNIFMNGGYCTYFHGGNGGELSVDGSSYQCNDGEDEDGSIQTFGGNGGIATVSAGLGGNAGSVVIKGSAHRISVRGFGGTGFNESGGTGGSVIVHGMLHAVGYGLKVYGGDCESVNETHAAGFGGYISAAMGLHAEGPIVTNGGNRAGTTTTPNDGQSAEAGWVEVFNGDFCASTVQMNGGNSTTYYKSSGGGSGGKLNVLKGNIIITDSLYATGGNSNGGDGGRGGAVSCGGQLNCNTFMILIAGSSFPASGDSEVGEKGYSQVVDALSGCNIASLDMSDGTDGNDTTGGVSLNLAGYCNIGSLTFPDRAEAKIKPVSSDSRVSLMIKSMIGKTTLNTTSIGESAAITPLTGAEIFKCSGDAWYKITGTSL